MTKKMLVMLLLALALIAAGCTSADPDSDDTTTTTDDGSDVAMEDPSEPADDGGTSTSGGTLQAVEDRGTLNCGINGVLAGFSLNEGGEYVGFDVDFCKAVAAAVLGDPEAVEYVELDADTRFTALQSGEIDVLIRNSTWTASRDGDLGLDWVQTTFYDGRAWSCVPVSSRR